MSQFKYYISTLSNTSSTLHMYMCNTYKFTIVWSVFIKALHTINLVGIIGTYTLLVRAHMLVTGGDPNLKDDHCLTI